MQHNNANNIYKFIYEICIQTIRCPIYTAKFAWPIVSEMQSISALGNNYLLLEVPEITPLNYSQILSYNASISASIHCENKNLRLMQELLDMIRRKFEHISLESRKFRLSQGKIASIKILQHKNTQWESNISIKANVLEKTIGICS